MSRATLAADRVMAAIAGLVLVAVGAGLVVWWGGWWQALPDRVDVSAVASWAGEPWWPWALGGAGVVLVLVGLRWLAGHVPNRGVGQLRLAGSDGTGQLRVDAVAVASAAAQAFADTPGVRSASGAIRRDRGQLVALIRATVEPAADLAVVASAADLVSAQLHGVLQRDDLHCRVGLRVAGRGRAQPRVH